MILKMMTKICTLPDGAAAQELYKSKRNRFNTYDNELVKVLATHRVKLKRKRFTFNFLFLMTYFLLSLSHPSLILAPFDVVCNYVDLHPGL